MRYFVDNIKNYQLLILKALLKKKREMPKTLNQVVNNPLCSVIHYNTSLLVLHLIRNIMVLN